MGTRVNPDRAGREALHRLVESVECLVVAWEHLVAQADADPLDAVLGTPERIVVGLAPQERLLLHAQRIGAQERGPRQRRAMVVPGVRPGRLLEDRCAGSRDGGVAGVVIRLGRGFAEVRADGTQITAGAMALDYNVALTSQDAGIAGNQKPRDRLRSPDPDS